MKTVKVTIFLMIAIAIVAGSAFAAPARVGSLEQNVQDPVRVALDSKSNVYVTDAMHDRVQVFDSKGQYKTSLSVPYPLGIAVDANGAIYVASGREVRIFNPDLTKAGCLGGATCASFKKPNDIYIDGTGKIYVADSHPETSIVAVFDAAGGRLAAISGTGATRLNKPMGVAVNEAGEIFIADKPNVTTSSGVTIGARIQAFDAAGTSLRSLGQFGSEVGQITEPVDIAIDAKGQLYITDGFQGVVHIMNAADGTIVGALTDPAKPGFNANGVAIGKNGIAYVVMQKGEGSTGRIDLYALDGYVTMAVSPSSLVFEGRQYAGNPAAQAINIANSGSGTLNWTATASQPWIILGQTAGTTGAAGSTSLTVGVDLATLVPGAQTGSVTVASDFGQQETITVTVNVQKPLILNISNGWLSFAAKKGGAAAAQTVEIGVDNLATTAGWTAKSDSTWLTVAPASGTATAASPKALVSVSVNTAGMAVGTSTGVITLSAPGVIGDGSTITVTLTVTATTKISVSANRTEAKFTVSGPASYSGSGASWSVEDAPAGEYTVAFEALAGYRKPEAQKKTLVENGEAAFSGKYVSFQEIASAKNIVVAKGSGGTNDGLIKAYKNTGEAVAAFDFEALASKRGANVAIGDVDGDGAADLIVGSGPGSAALIRVFRADRSLLQEFAPFEGDAGVRVAAGDLDGNGTAEILYQTARSDSEETSGLTAAVFDKASGTLQPSGMQLKADRRSSFAAADVDGDGTAELVVISGGSGRKAAVARVLKVDGTQGAGNWNAAPLSEVSLGEDMIALAVASGDVDGDGKDEIIVAGRIEKTQGSVIETIKDGGIQSKFTLFDKSEVLDISLAAADLDGDAKADLVVAPSVRLSKQRKGVQRGQEPGLNGQVRVYGADGSLKFSVTAYERVKDGVNVAVGDLGL